MFAIPNSKSEMTRRFVKILETEIKFTGIDDINARCSSEEEISDHSTYYRMTPSDYRK
jgi:hypothetical protein